MAKYNIYTDGSCNGNPGPGGWGVVIMNEDNTKIIHLKDDVSDYTTNNRMELSAMLYALDYAENHPDDNFTIYSDSAYVVNSCTNWIFGWAANNWCNSKKQKVENIDYMMAIYDHLKRAAFFGVDIQKCKGHEGDLGNELADALATHNIKKWNDIIDYWEFEVKAGDNWFPID